ncbi:MAG: RdgB/HAM1 family non-canonical purine NTP pyrophosphatase [Candidatus Parcubacteria bacterium]|nr:RdgB/HAM1 family non-canonical purine NTP pyrophosphatase [Candidatus Parcubacteria bacterium]
MPKELLPVEKKEKRPKMYFITGNKGKLHEVQSILPDVEQLDIDLPEIQEIDARKVVEAKLLEALKNHKGEFIIEDTSLYLDCLNGLPGPLIKWFLKTIGNNGLAEIARKYGNYKAQAKTIIGYAKNPQEIYFFEGDLEGEIAEPTGETGFGWDPIFKPRGFAKTFAEMTREEKNKISMRRQALNKLKQFLEEQK